MEQNDTSLNPLLNEIFAQLKKIKIIPPHFLIAMMRWLIARMMLGAVETDHTTFFILALQKYDAAIAAVPMVVVVAVPAKGMYLDNGYLVINDVLPEKRYLLSSITGLKRNGSIVDIYFVEGPSKTLSSTIKKLDALLKRDGFYSPMKNSIVNIIHVKLIDKGVTGEVHLPNDVNFDISETKKAELRRLHKQHQSRL